MEPSVIINLMLGIIFAFLAYFSWAIGDFFGAVASRKAGGLTTSFWVMVIIAILGALYVPFSYTQLQNLTFTTFWILLTLIILGPIPLVAFNEGLRVGNASLVGTIGGSFAAVVVILSILFLKEPITIPQILSITVIFLGIFLSSFDLKLLNNKKLITDPGIPYALIALIGWGIYFTFIKIPVSEIGWFWPPYLSQFGFISIYLYSKLKGVSVFGPKLKASLPQIMLSSIIGNTGFFSYNYAISIAPVAIVAPIAGSYPTLFVFLAFLIFRDKITKQQILGILTTLAGIVLLSFLSI